MTGNEASSNRTYGRFSPVFMLTFLFDEKKFWLHKNNNKAMNV
jgi:hypothetical protein